MRFVPSTLHGAWLIEPEPVHDARGFFARTFCTEAFGERGLESNYLQHSRSLSLRTGTLRGMHFQRAPHAETKVVTCVAGAIFDVILDLRKDSPTYLRWQSFDLTADNRRHVYIPKGFAHGFQTLTDNAEVHYLISSLYQPNASTGVRFDDAKFGIIWPMAATVISERDLAWPLLGDGDPLSSPN